MKKISRMKTIWWVASLLMCMLVEGAAQAAQQEQAYTTANRYFNGLLVGTISPDPDGAGSLRLLATRNTYSQGQLIRVEKGQLATWPDEDTPVSSWAGFDVYQKQEMTYDDYGRKATVTGFDKNSAVLSLTEYSYDDHSRVLCTAVRMNLAATGNACNSANLTGPNPDRISRFTYNDFGQVTTEERAVGTTIQQTYVTNTYSGKLLRFQSDANGNRTELRYDSSMRLARVVYPSPTAIGQVNEGDYVAYNYDTNGNKNYERKRNGAEINYTIDNNNRVTLKDYVNNATQPDIAYTYDLRGLQLSAIFTSTSKGIINTFDGFGNLASTTNTMFATPRTLTYTYDLNNNRTKIQHPDGITFSYDFDGLNRVAAIKDNANANLLNVIYQANGRRANLSRANNTVTSYTFQNGVQLSSFDQTFSNSATNNLTNSFTYNNAGQIETLTQSNNRYYYTGNENRTGVYASNGLNQYTTIAGQVLNKTYKNYDLNGNLIDDGINTYSYDDENRLLNVLAPATNAGFVYDPNGRLFQSNVDNQPRQFLYDGDALVLKYDTSGGISRRYVHGDQVDEPLVQYGSAGVAVTDRVYLHADHQGSIIVRSNSAGAVMTAAAYDAYGVPKDESTDASGFGYTGQIYFKSLELDYYKARFYSPKLGRFLQTDPIGYKDDYDLYSYVGNDPLNRTDPTGTQCKTSDGKSECTVDYIQVKNKDGKTQQVLLTGDLRKQMAGSKFMSQITRLEKNMTKGYAAAVKAGGTSFSVEGKKFTGTDVATRLEHAYFTASTERKFNKDGSESEADNTGNPTNNITYYQPSYGTSDQRQQTTTIHEGLHSIPWIGSGSGTQSHQKPFNDAADEVLQNGQ